MRVFSFDGSDLRATYETQGWLHVSGGVTGEFLDYARAEVDRSGALQPLDGSAIHGAKTQYVFRFPVDFDFKAQLLDVVARLTGWEPGTVTLSERHIKAYLPDADPLPTAHKDRFASAIAIGLTLQVGEGSHVVLYPETDRITNPHLTAGLNDTLLEHERPSVVLSSAPEVCVQDLPGDVLAFPGNNLWHLRRNSASTVLLYLKFNNFGSDPLAEDPETLRRRRVTTDVLSRDGALLASHPVLSQVFDSVGCETGREPGRTMWHVNVWQDGERQAVAVPEAFASVMQSPIGGTVEQLATDGVAGLYGDDLVHAVRTLARVGALDLLLRDMAADRRP